MSAHIRRRSLAAALALTVVAAWAAVAVAATAKPSITRFAPLSAKPLASITLTGKNFIAVKSVKIAGLTAKFKTASATKITATLPSTAKSGKVAVTTAGGTATSAATLKVLPTITGVSPSSAKPLATVTINGKAFVSVKTVKIAGVTATFKAVSATKITATVPSAAKSGKIVVTTAAGSATSPTSLTVVVAAAVTGNAAAGKSLFVSTCAACHTLKAAGAQGTLGPNLDDVPLPEQTLINAITNGGSTVMTPAEVAKYQTTMIAYKGTLSTTQISDIAAFVYASTHS
jgi:mono/diheme cytochrome c family protein